MNYYNPNYYMNYPYNNQYPYTQMPQQQQIAQPSIQQLPNLPNSQPTPALNGKIVDGEDVVKATEVPIGGYGIFPKADLSEIYLKTWNNNGTTSIVKFQPVIQNAETQGDGSEIARLIDQVGILEAKIDTLLAPQTQQPRKEVKNNGF